MIDVSEVETEPGNGKEEIEINTNETNVNVNDSVNRTFHNPSQDDKSPSEEIFKCEKCDFEAKAKIDIINHKKEVHNWCESCFSTFNSKKKLKNHILKIHKE